MIRVLVGDSRHTLKALPAASVECVITSPPYFGLRDYQSSGQIGREETLNEYVASLCEVFTECWRVLKPTGTLWLNLADTYAGQGHREPNIKKNGSLSYRAGGLTVRPKGIAAKNLLAIPWRVALGLQGFAVLPTAGLAEWSEMLAQAIDSGDWELVGMVLHRIRAESFLSSMREQGWILRQDIIWSKPNPMPESAGDRCTKAHEYVFLFSKRRKYYYDADAIREPASAAMLKQIAEGYDGEATKDFGSSGAQDASAAKRSIIERKREKIRGHERENEGLTRKWDNLTKAEQQAAGSNKRSVWTVATHPFKGAHFATYPPDLIKPCILAGCPAGGTVLDPFAGSGTTGAVALEYGRKAILCEINPKFAAMAEARCAKVTPGFSF